MATPDQETATTEIRPGFLMRKFIPSFTTISLVAYFIISLLMNGDIKPLTKRGFFCNDPTIRYPFMKDTISVKLLLLIALVIPGIVIKLCDRNLRKSINNRPNISIKMVETRDLKRRKISGDFEDLDADEAQELIESQARRRQVTNGKEPDNEVAEPDSGVFTSVPLDKEKDVGELSRLSLVFRRSFGDFQLFLFGFCTTMLFTGIGKIACGRFRPHFIQRCQPDVDCSLYSDGVATYVEEFTCTNSQLTSRDMSYITTSWPSGHAAIMFFSMTYMIVYSNRIMSAMLELSKPRNHQMRSPLLLYGLYVMMIGLAGYIAGTRVSDYHHHTLDVFSGALIGFAIAFVLTKSIPVRISPVIVS